VFLSDTEKDSKRPPINSHVERPHLTKCLKSQGQINVEGEKLSPYSPRASSKSVLLGELIPVTKCEALRTLAGFRKGRSEARESKPIKQSIHNR